MRAHVPLKRPQEKLSSVVENRRFLSFTHVEWTGRLSINELPPEVSWVLPAAIVCWLSVI